MIYSTDEDNQKYNGSYTKTPMHVLKKIFEDISFEKEKRSLLMLDAEKVTLLQLHPSILLCVLEEWNITSIYMTYAAII